MVCLNLREATVMSRPKFRYMFWSYEFLLWLASLPNSCWSLLVQARCCEGNPPPTSSKTSHHNVDLETFPISPPPPQMWCGGWGTIVFHAQWPLRATVPSGLSWVQCRTCPSNSRPASKDGVQTSASVKIRHDARRRPVKQGSFFLLVPQIPELVWLV